MSSHFLNAISSFQKILKVPGDKSVSHRSLIFGAIASGSSEIKDILDSADVRSTASCLRQLGVDIEFDREKTIVHGLGLKGLKAPTEPLDCGNSGTTMRLLVGLLAGQTFSCQMVGDVSLTQRPMKRVVNPLRQMGAQINLREGNFPPIDIVGQPLSACHYELPVASAQVKSALLLAGLYAEGRTVLTGQLASRDHTERLLPYFGVPLSIEKEQISIDQGELVGQCVQVPGDPSSAAFWLSAAAIVPGSQITLTNLSLNPTRTGFIEVLKRMGADISIQLEVEEPEPIGSVTLKYKPLKATTLEAAEIPFLVDEVPLVALLGSQAEGVTKVTGAQELRVKECDRIDAIEINLKAMGVHLDTFQDGFTIEGIQSLKGAAIECFHDHRIAMMFSIAALIAEGKTEILDPQCVAISYPDFFEVLKSLVD